MQNLPLILKPGKVKNIFLIIISLGFVILGISLLEQKLWLGVLNIFFFGICLIIFLSNMLPNSSYLKINDQGIEMKNLFRSTFIPWKAVSGFKTKSFFINKVVTFDIDRDLLESSKMRRKTGAFPDTYGMPPEKLAHLLNEYKSKSENNELLKELS